MKEKSVSVVLIVLGAAILAASGGRIAWGEPGTLTFMGAFVAVTVPLLFARVRLEPQSKAYAMDDVSIYAMVFVTASGGAAPDWTAGGFVMFAASLLYELYYLLDAVRRRGWARIDRRMLFFRFTNPFAKVVYYTSAGVAYTALNHGDPFLGTHRNLTAIGAAIVCYMAVTMAADLADTWVRVGSVAGMVDFYSQLLLHIAMMAPLSIILALFWQQEPVAVALLAAPVAVMHASMKAVRNILDDAQLTIEAMAVAIEERDHYTAGHSERVARYAGAIASFIGLPRDEVQQIENAGRIHDLGKIDIPDAILRKPGSLTDDEYKLMQSHTDRTLEYHQKYAKLGRQIPFGIAAMHHEKYDGSGYVYGLKGERIPLGSRILAVADTWDAMTSDRPYRKGLGDEEGLRRLDRGAGTQFDPFVVEAFKAMYAAGIITDTLEEWKRYEAARQVKKMAQQSAPRRP